MTTAPPVEGTTVLFDWNGTVVLDAERARSSLNQVLIRRELAHLDRAAFRREFHLPMADMFRRLGVRETSSAEDEWNDAMMSSGADARDGVATLRELHAAGIRLGVVSAASDGAVHADMIALGLEEIWGSIDAPAVDKLAVLRSRRGYEADAFYVGDTVYDMECALAAGFTPIGVDGGYTDTDALRFAGAEFIVSSFAELPAVLGLSVATR